MGPISTSDARARLAATVQRFRAEGDTAEPVVVGTRRRAEAVIIPAGQYDLFLELVEDAAIALRLAEREAPGDGRRFTLAEVAAELEVDLTA